jgi:hypothetical protein
MSTGWPPLPVIEIGPSFIAKIVKVVHHWRLGGLLMELRGGEGIGVECVCVASPNGEGHFSR